MEWTPYKRVGAPATFKGVKGPYLSKLIIAVLCCFAVFIFISVAAFPLMVSLTITVVALFGLLVIYNFLKSKSKGDLNEDLKKKCRIDIAVKATPINYDIIRKN